MRKLILSTLSVILLFAVSCSCGTENKPGNGLDTKEQKAVETQVEKDQAAMDSLEVAIKAQINGTDTVK